MKLLPLLLLLTSFFTGISCSGFMELTLKSEYSQDVTVIIGEETNPTYLSLPILLQQSKQRKFGPFPVDFDKKYKLKIVGGKTERLGLNSSIYTADFKPSVGKLRPRDIHLPLNGLEISFGCDKNYGGPKCTYCGFFCRKQTASESRLYLYTDYTLDPDLLPTVIERLKQTTSVENGISDDEEEEGKKSPVFSLFQSIMDLAKNARKDSHRKESRVPIRGRGLMNADVLRKPRPDISELMGPLSIMTMMPTMMSSITTSISSEKPAIEGSGESLDDFPLDQIFG